MTRPMGPDDPAFDLARVRQRVTRLERRPADIDAGAVGAAMWPMSQDLLPFDGFHFGIDGESSPFWSTPTLSSTYMNGYYVERSTDQAKFTIYARLGPKGSAWGINMVADTGTDCGIIRWSFQVISEDATGSGYALDGQGLIPGSTDRGPTTYYEPPDNTIDLYNNPGAVQQVFDGHAQFRIMGDDGAAITANAVNNGGPYYEFDGGAGIWAIQGKIDGKNASSSGYRVRLADVRLRRWTSDGFPTT